MKLIASVFSFVFLLGSAASAQQSQEIKNNNVKQGQKALMDGDFKQAVVHLEKAIPAEGSNPDVLYMLGYSYYHSGSYTKAISTFGQVVNLKPNNVSAYYYRGKARNVLGTQMNSTLSAIEKEKLLLASIRDYSKAIELNAADQKLYQNRAIAYRDYGILKGQKIPKFYDKAAAANSFKSCIGDLQKVLDANPGRKDITDEMKKAKVYMANLDR